MRASFWVELTSEWYEGAMVFPVFIFIFFFRTNGKKEHSGENDLRYSYGNYFESVIIKVIWYQLFSKFFLNIYEAH